VTKDISHRSPVCCRCHRPASPGRWWKTSGPLLVVVLVNICPTLATPGPAGAEFLSLDANWQLGQVSGTSEEQEDISTYSQRYHLQWAPQISRALFFDANMNYSDSWARGAGSRQLLSPTANLMVRNDLFQAELNGLLNKTKNSDISNKTETTWEGALRSNWEYPFWPELSATFGQNRSRDDRELPLFDRYRDWLELTAQWNYSDFETYYSYYKQNREDDVDGSALDEARHLGRIDYQRLLFAGKGNVSFSQQISTEKSNFTAALHDGSANIIVPLSRGISGVDNIPETGALPSNPALIDGNLEDTAFTIRLHETANIGVKADFQTVDILYVYTPELEPAMLNETAAIGWDLYASSNGIEWQLIRKNPATSYDPERFRYNVAVGGTQAIYLKLVVTAWPLLVDIPITEIRAFRSESGTGTDLNEEQDYTRYLTDFNLRYNPTAATQISYSLVWDNSEYSNGGNDRDRLFQSANFRWFYNRYFTPSLTINNTDTKNARIEDTIRRSYGLTVESHPLQNLEGSLSLTRNETFEDSVLTNSNHTISLLSFARLYPDLDSTLDINLIINNDELDEGGGNEAFGIRWTLTSRLRESLIADLITEYGANTLDFTEVSSDNDSGGRTTLNINWRPSDLVSLLVNGSQGYGERWSNYQSFLLNGQLSVIRTSKMQLILGYRINSTKDDTLHGFNCNWTWNISQYLSSRSNGNYILTDDGTVWTLSTRLTATF
jgi:hypothetical protein